ncbi:MAG: glycosyltransferase family 39 protein [Candidatus Moranbacteria bacterium]|nr:glycosyltransferase family 39 protein [Candidatus Moranbacteria bacterium]
MSPHKKMIAILCGIILVGFVFRAYNFSEWLRFNMDQSRDIGVVENSIQEGVWPPLGPRAGGTDFKLGPAFYYFQIISARIFGATPEAAAYPDLFFSLLSIPLFFLLARIYFNKPIALSLTWLFSISYFVIKYSRFAWNPNSTPFFTMLFLYAVYRIGGSQGNRKVWWAATAGVAMGVGIQLHTTLLIIMPIAALFFTYYLFKGGSLTKGCVIAVVAGALLVNAPQIASELQTGGMNTRVFILSVTEKNERNTSISDNLALDVSCHIRANYGILAAYGNEEECGYGDLVNRTEKLDSKRVPLTDKTIFVAYVIVASVFSIGGYYIAFRELKKQEDKKKKLFAKLAATYTILTFLFFIVWATELSMRFFLILEFVPFLLLGFWLKFLWVRSDRRWLAIALVIVASFFNLQKDFAVFRDLQFGGREINGDFEYITLGEAEFITGYMRDNLVSDSKTAYVDAQAGYLFKSLKSLRFVAKKSDLEVVELSEDVKLAGGSQLFYLRNAEEKCELPSKVSKKYEIKNCSVYRQFSIFDLRVK